ncbi:hypothetical protein [Emticicia sp. 21SJ11W-3]|uniref:hypothetical protein n=1 Tax=Emticicia sp. 21SJ11W-3 TaxID=2916755 RepID=UPI0020A18B66|nr:hypothetical protein [Emticicia sp. 21SJ11W-3]UTA66224.1 hypothetical protein MB380_11445 [Emticicia sp. 21SJ11W-3]
MEANQQPKPEEEEVQFPEYPKYPASEDIYARGIKEETLDPENPTQDKAPNEIDRLAWNEADGTSEASGDDLDVPGAELDDADEAIGKEDEENNYYSLGGDNHTDLEESQSDVRDNE